MAPSFIYEGCRGCGWKGFFLVAISKPFFRALSLCVCSSALFLSPAAFGGPVPQGDVYVGYSRTGMDTFYPNMGGLNGWEGAMHVKMHAPFIGVEGDLSHYGLGANSTVPRTTAFIFGPRVTVCALGPKIFAHALIGGEHSANSGGPTPISSTALAYALGGGFRANSLRSPVTLRFP
jgi:hypothetical protein